MGDEESTERQSNQGSEQRENGKCFVIAPIGSDNSEARSRTEDLLDYVIEPVVEEGFGLDVEIAHDIDEPGNITRQVMELLFEAELVIADLTEHNPNVMYELAVRHATRKPVVTVAKDGITPPFDIGPQRTKFYELGFGGAEDFKVKLEAAVGEALSSDHEPDNPIQQVRKGFTLDKVLEEDIEQLSGEEGVEVADVLRQMVDRIDSLESRLDKSSKGELKFEDPDVAEHEFVMQEQSLDEAEIIAARLSQIPELYSAFAHESRGPGKSRLQVFAPQEMDVSEIMQMIGDHR